MGSSGTGRFSDYSGSKREYLPGEGEPTGGSSGEDPCDQALSTTLEEIERCDYFRRTNSVPGEGEEVRIDIDGRVCATTVEGELIGYLPTRFNYLASCIYAGRKYGGVVVSVSIVPVVSIDVDISILK